MARRYDLLLQLMNGSASASELMIDSLDRRKCMYRSVGWLYALRNPAFKDGLLKIGKTARFPTERAEELGSTTGLPEGFQLVHYIHVQNRHQAERYVHLRLADERYRANREFFQISLARLGNVFDQAAQRFPVTIKSSGTVVPLPQDYGQLQTVHCALCRTKNRIRPLAIEIQFRCAECGGVLEV